MRFITKYWKRILLALLGSFAASTAVKKARSHRNALDVDNGPIVQELTLRQRFTKLIPKPKPKRDSSGAFGTSAQTTSPKKIATKVDIRDEPQPPRRQISSKDVADQAQRTRNKSESLNNTDDFGIDRNLRR